MSDTDIVSVSRTYVLFIEDPNNPPLARIHKLTLSATHEPNNVVAAIRYYINMIDPHAKIVACVTYERYMERAERIFENPDLIAKSKLFEEIKEVLGEFSKKDPNDIEDLEIFILLSNFIRKSNLVQDIKILLATYYTRDLEDIGDLDILMLIKKLEQENTKYLAIIGNVTQAIKTGLKEKRWRDR